MQNITIKQSLFNYFFFKLNVHRYGKHYNQANIVWKYNNPLVQCYCGHDDCPFCNLLLNLERTDPNLLMWLPLDLVLLPLFLNGLGKERPQPSDVTPFGPSHAKFFCPTWKGLTTKPLLWECVRSKPNLISRELIRKVFMGFWEDNLHENLMDQKDKRLLSQEVILEEALWR